MALLPPPPTPITLMTLDWFLGRSNDMLSNSGIYFFFCEGYYIFLTIVFFILRCQEIV